jgi:hypothetical protein
MFVKEIYSYLLIALCLLRTIPFNASEIIPENDKMIFPMKEFLLPDSLGRDTISSQDLLMNYPKSRLYQRPFFLSAKYSEGKVLGKIQKLDIGYAQYFELKVGVSSLGNRWKDIVYGMPYYGIGTGFYDLNSSQTGRPISIYLFQGDILKAFSRRSILKYEWNFGTSFNWKRYHPVTNPDNVYIGAPINIYFAANIYQMFGLSKELDLNVGLTFNHVSNGATRMPNSGINMLAGFVGLTYYFDRDRVMNEFNPSLRAPVYKEKRLISDFSIHSTVRQRKFSTEETGLSSKYLDRKFFVLEASYALLHMPNYNYRYGAGFDIVYDESAGFTAKKVGEKPDGSDIAEFRHGCSMGRLALGLSFRGEIVLPKYSVSGQLGYEVIKGNKQDSRLYQTFSVRVPLLKGLYGSFILRAQNFNKAQYMFLGIGCMIDHKPVKKR